MDDVAVECTDTDFGFSLADEYSDTLTWKSVRNGVKKVELAFRDTRDYFGHAQIAEMEIVYYEERNNRCKFTVTMPFVRGLKTYF